MVKTLTKQKTNGMDMLKNVCFTTLAAVSDHRVKAHKCSAKDRTDLISIFPSAFSKNKVYSLFDFTKYPDICEVVTPYYNEFPAFYDYSTTLKKKDKTLGFFLIIKMSKWEKLVPRVLSEESENSDYFKYRAIFGSLTQKGAKEFIGEDLDRTAILSTFASAECTRSEKDAAITLMLRPKAFDRARAGGLKKWIIYATHPTTVWYAKEYLKGELLATTDFKDEAFLSTLDESSQEMMRRRFKDYVGIPAVLYGGYF